MDKPDVSALVWFMAETIPAWPPGATCFGYDTPSYCWLLMPREHNAAGAAGYPLIRFDTTPTQIDMELSGAYRVDIVRATFVHQLYYYGDVDGGTTDVELDEWSQARAWLDHQRIYGDNHAPDY